MTHRLQQLIQPASIVARFATVTPPEPVQVHHRISDVAPPVAKPVTMAEIKYAAAFNAWQTEGSQQRAAARLGIRKNTLRAILRLMVFAVLALCLSASAVQAQPHSPVSQALTIPAPRDVTEAVQQLAILRTNGSMIISSLNTTPPAPPKPATLANQIGSAPVLSTNTTQAITTVPAPPVRPLGSVELSWNPSPDSSVTGYRVYQGGITGNYTNSYAVGNRINATVAPLLEGVTYYFVVTAYDAVGTESRPSNEVQFTAQVRGTIEIAAWRYKNPGILGQTNEIVESTDGMKTWRVIKTFVGDGTVQSVTATNYAAANYRVRLKGKP